VAVTAGTLRRLRALAARVGGTVDDTVRALTRAWTRTWDDLTPVWRRAVDDLVSAATTTGLWLPPWQMYRLPSVAAAATRTSTALTGLAAEAGITTAAGASTVVAATAAAEPSIIASQLPASMAADAAAVYAARLLPTALDVIVARTAEQITSLTRPLGPAADEAVRLALVRGVALGEHPNRVARDMLRRVEGAFAGGLSRAIVIARTEQVDAHREASRYVHQANADVLAGWVWLSRLDRRACLACWVMHGSEFPVAEPGPAGHPQCRCARMPKVRLWRELGIPIDEPDDQLVDARARFDALDDVDQLAVMGAARLRLLRSGAISWNDLVVRRDNPGWRPSYAPRPVRDLQRLADRRAA
jgi:SPP1 gp7 family putative phage head morphogenesis protein